MTPEDTRSLARKEKDEGHRHIEARSYRQEEAAQPGDGEGGAQKKDAGKLPVARGVLGYFPHALAQVAAVSDFGAQKYDWDGWRDVPNAVQRYSDGLARHLLDHLGGCMYNDKDGGLPHIAQVAWNALAVLELLLDSGELELTTANYTSTPPPS